MYFGKRYETAPQGDTVADERRTMHRRHLIYYLRVWDSKTEQLLGHIVDIHIDGFMLVSEKPIETGKEFDLEIRWHPPEEEMQTLQLQATSRWSSNDVNPDFFDTGFQLLDTSEEVLQPVQEIIRELGFGE